MLRKQIRTYEYIHIPFWLVKDTCWALQIKSLGLLMIIPTFLLSLIIVYKTRKLIHDLLPNISISLWIAANSIWMCDEFFELGIKWVCYIPFLLGITVILFWLFRYFPGMWRGDRGE